MTNEEFVSNRGFNDDTVDDVALEEVIFKDLSDRNKFISVEQLDRVIKTVRFKMANAYWDIINETLEEEWM